MLLRSDIQKIQSLTNKPQLSQLWVHSVLP